MVPIKKRLSRSLSQRQKVDMLLVLSQVMRHDDTTQVRLASSKLDGEAFAQHIDTVKFPTFPASASEWC